MEPPKVIEFVPGDRIAFTVQFTHKMNITKVWTSMVLQDAINQAEITFEAYRTTQDEGDHKLTTVEFVSTDVVPDDGVFVLSPIFATTYMGRTINLQEVPDIRCRVRRDEPFESPQLSHFGWDSTQYPSSSGGNLQ